MSEKNDFVKIFRESFRTSRQWTDWFMGEVYRDEDVVALRTDDKVVSVLLLSPVTMSFHGQELQASYISCAATAAAERGKGYMSRLITAALADAERRGDAFVMLIPESRRLYFFYARFGFATSFWIDEQRYTSLHAFEMPDNYMPVEPTYAIFSELERLQTSGVRHTRRDYENVVHDIELDRGHVVAVSDPAGDSRAMAFVNVDENITVKAILSTDAVAAEAAMSVVRSEAGEKPVVIMAPPGERNTGLHARGMARIVDVEKVLGTVARAFPKIKITIKVHDRIISRNNSTFDISDGRCSRDSATIRRPDVDVDVEVLCGILSSSDRIASLFGLPGARPVMNLMLD